MKLNPNINDPFDPYCALVRSLRLWQGVCTALVVLLAVVMGWGMLSWSRPPVVITKSTVLGGEGAQVIATHKVPAVTVDDAKVFFWAMLRLRWEWDSLTVERDMLAFRRHCLSPQRMAEDQHLAELVPSSPEEGAEKISRLHWWITAKVRNNLVLPRSLDDIECQERDELFHCRLQTQLVTQSMLPAAGETPAMHRVTFLGTLVRVPHRIETPYGLAVAALRQLPTDSAKDRG